MGAVVVMLQTMILQQTAADTATIVVVD